MASSLPPIYFERLLEDSPDIVIAVNRAGEIVFYNDGARTALGYAADEVLGRRVDIVYRSLDDAKQVMAAMRDPKIDAPGKVSNFQTTLRTSSGEDMRVAISGVLIHDDEGRETGSIGFARDLHEIHRQDQLTTLGEIAVSVAHELNNPITAILNNLALLGRDVRDLAGDADCEIELERVDSIGTSIGKIKVIVDRLTEKAGAGEYDTLEYMPGKVMFNLRHAEEDAAAAAEKAKASEARAAELNGHALRGLHVLVADDDLAVCHSVEDLLRSQGCRVTTARNGREAEELLERGTYDLVLSDVVMPDIDGYELFRYVREHHPTTPVVLMTAFFYDRDHVIKRSKLAGLDGVLYKKPVDPGRLVELVREHCRR
jgi:PAS domain S-box-containing protein